MIKRFTGYYRPHIRLFAADMLCAFCLSACDFFYPMITRTMIDDYIPNGALRPLLIWAAVLILIYFVKMELAYFIQYYGHIVGVRMQADMRREVFDHLEKLPLTYFDNHKTGTIMSRIITDLQDISELAHHGPEDLFVSGVMLIGSFIMMASIHLPLTLIVFAALPAMVFFAVKKQRKMSAAFTATRVEIGEINASLENSISGIRVSKAYTSRAYENEHFTAGNKKYVAARARAYKVMAEFSAGTTLIGDILNVLLYVAGGIFCYRGDISAGDFAAFLIYISLFMNPVRRIVGFIEQYQNGMSGFKRFLEIMDTPPEEDAPGATEMGEVRGEISFDEVDFSYTDGGHRVLDRLSFTLAAGRTLALVGPSGGGKTTICHLIPRFYEVIGGAVCIDGRDIREVTRASLRQNIGIVAQDVFLFNATIYENIAYGCSDATREEVETAAKRANIHEHILSMPDGYNTVVGERGLKLSGGQKQRIAIARVFLKNPPILILDEATSALDNATELLIQKSLEELCRGRTTVIVAHRLTTIRHADEILVVTDSGIAERGTHEELLQMHGIYHDLWQGVLDASPTV